MEAIEREPSVVFASSCSQDATSIITKLIGCECCSPIFESEDFDVYSWRINNKYYETPVHLIAMKRKELIPKKLAGGVQAVVLLFDSYDQKANVRMSSWYDGYLQHYDAYVKILLCARMDDEDPKCMKRLEAHQWCFVRGFELVELDPIVDEEWEAEQDFHESTGMLRVRQALEAHYWPNLSLKEKNLPRSMDELWHGGQTLCTSSIDEIREIPQCEPAACAECVESTSFDGLTLKDLIILKDQAEKLPRCDKQRFAEQVVRTFYRSITEDESD